MGAVIPILLEICMYQKSGVQLVIESPTKSPQQNNSVNS